MRIILISDTHELHDQVKVPDGDILIHAGDMTMHGEFRELARFNHWMGTLPHKHKIVIAGNHDRTLELQPALARPILDKVTYLQDELIEVEGIKIYGSPWTPHFGSEYWRFHTHSDEERVKLWDKIPEGLDILVTHGPPKGILDGTLEGDEAGDRQLHDRVLQVRPRIHVFGHIHEDYGHCTGGSLPALKERKLTDFYNASVVDRLYQVRNEPWVLEVEVGKEKEIQRDQAGEGEGERAVGATTTH